MATFTGLSLISIAAIASMFLQVGPAFSEIRTPFQRIFQSRRPFQQIFHPPTGLCVIRKTFMDPLKLGPCDESERWSYTPQKLLTIKGTYFCLQAAESNKPAKLGIICTEPGSQWDSISDSKNHLSSTLANGNSVCLDVDPEHTIITNLCKCLSGDHACESTNQWFEIVTTTTDQIQ
ncbi:glycosyl hydrolase 5 family protein-like [Tasmannia lanceolata]|uniref:glycosyl hydrolase 5 family protein-like n=1 Tax=Tasmannia lanceolata TaxID=3420 RepID=UPI004064AA9A